MCFKMKIAIPLILFFFFAFNLANAQSTEIGLHYQPNKFHLTNPAEKSTTSEYSQVASTLASGRSIGIFINRITNKQNGFQADLDFMSQRQNYNYSSLLANTNTIYTRLNTFNLGVSHNFYFWDYENDDNIFFSYGLSGRFLMNYTDYYNVEIETKINGVAQTDAKTTIIENDNLITTVTHNDTLQLAGAEAKTGASRYSSINVGANFGIHFLHYFSDNFALTAGAKAIVYFMDPENKASEFWSTTSKFKYSNIATDDKRVASKMSSFGVSLSLVYCLGR